MMDTRLLDKGTVYPADWLVKAFKIPRSGRPWHDSPEGEYLVITHIPSLAFLGSVSYEAMHQQIETLIPELADKPHQLLAELRKYYHGKQKEIVRAARGEQGWPVEREEYYAARHISKRFGFIPDRPGYRHSLLLVLMILSFRRREAQTLPWSEISKDFAGMNVSLDIQYEILTSSRGSDFGMLTIFSCGRWYPAERARVEGVAATCQLSEE